MDRIEWDKVGLVIFDLDGTLYDQKKLRKKMAREILCFLLRYPWRFREIFIVGRFRKERESRAGYSCPDLDRVQYEWVATGMSISFERVKSVVDKWIFSAPLKYLSSCTFPGVRDFIEKLRERGVQTAIYSDYEVDSKMKAIGLSLDYHVASTDPRVNSFKPRPNAVIHICRQAGVPLQNVLFIGDRYIRDGKCAENAGVHYLILPNPTHEKRNFFVHLAARF
ncbi:MAG: HAD family hydrolase [Niabella sp.]